MAGPVFISYSRRNTVFAKRLRFDLERVQIEAWLDESDIAPGARRWRPEVEAAIANSKCVVLLASPESAESEEVGREVVEAERLGRQIITRHIAGEFLKLPQEWRDRQIDVKLTDSYWDGFAKLLRCLHGPPCPASLTSLVNRGGMTVQAAAAELKGAVPLQVGEREYMRLPIEPSAYAMTWLSAPADAPLTPPPSLAVLLKFAGAQSKGGTAAEVLQFFSDNGKSGMWLMSVEGPLNVDPRHMGSYDLPLASAHIWEDAVRLALEAMQLPFVKGNDVHIFLAGPQTLIYAVAGQIRDVRRHHLYQYNDRIPGPSYWRVLGPKV